MNKERADLISSGLKGGQIRNPTWLTPIAKSFIFSEGAVIFARVFQISRRLAILRQNPLALDKDTKQIVRKICLLSAGKSGKTSLADS